MKYSRKQLADFLIDNPGKPALRQVASHLIHTGRSKEVDLVVREVEARLASQGTVVARVASAHELGATEEKSVERLVKQTTGATAVELINEIDPSLLGGVVVRTPGTETDVSVRNRLEQLKRA